MAEIKTKPTSESVEDFINSVPDEQKRKDSFVILEMMKKKATGRRTRKCGAPPSSALAMCGTKALKPAGKWIGSG